MCIGSTTVIHLVILEFLTNVYFWLDGVEANTKTILAKNTDELISNPKYLVKLHNIKVNVFYELQWFTITAEKVQW